MEDEAMAMVLVTPANRMWRTQIEIVDSITITATGETLFWLFIAGRPADENVVLSSLELPEHIRRIATVGKILHARCNTGAATKKDLRFEDWETQ